MLKNRGFGFFTKVLSRFCRSPRKFRLVVEMLLSKVFSAFRKKLYPDQKPRFTFLPCISTSEALCLLPGERLIGIRGILSTHDDMNMALVTTLSAFPVRFAYSVLLMGRLAFSNLAIILHLHSLNITCQLCPSWTFRISDLSCKYFSNVRLIFFNLHVPCL